MEEFLEDFHIGDFDTDVTVQGGGDQAGNDVHDVGGGLPVIRRETLHDGVVGVLALVRVHEDAEEHVDNVDKDVSAENAFPEVPGVSHLGHEGDEEHGAAVGVDGLVETVQGAGEAIAAARCTRGWCTSVSMNRSGTKV